MNRNAAAVWTRRGGERVSSPPVQQEETWIAASRKGDAAAFNCLVLQWEKIVFNMALRLLQDQEEAADATQEIFLLAFRNIKSFRGNSRFSTWLYRIASNLCISRIRCRPQAIHYSLDDGMAAVTPHAQLRTAGTQDGDLIREEDRLRIRSALAALPPEQRVVVELKFFQELTFEDIAGVLDVPLSTIKSRLYSGLAALKVRLGSRT